MRASPAGGFVPAGGGKPGKARARGAAPHRGGLAALSCPQGGDGRATAVPHSYPAKYPAVSLPRRHLWRRGCGRHRGQPAHNHRAAPGGGG